MERVYYATSRQKAYKIADRLIKQQRDKYGVICEMQYLWRIEERLWKLILRQVGTTNPREKKAYLLADIQDKDRFLAHYSG